MGRLLALTIDDSPTPLTGELAAFLQEKNLDAVFFCIGERLDRFPRAADALVRAGFLLGNHGFSHTAFSQMTLEEGLAEITATETRIEEVYRRNNAVRRAQVFRFPYGDKGGDHRKELQEFLSRKGFRPLEGLEITYPWYREGSLATDRDVFWTFDTQDYRLTDGQGTFAAADLLAHLEDPAPAQGGTLAGGTSDEILLMHDNEHTAKVFPGYYREILRRVEALGLVFSRPGTFSSPSG